MRALPILRTLAVVAVVVAPAASAQELGPFEGQADVGGARAGSTVYDPESQIFTVVGSGTNMWADRDEFRFVWKRMDGDFILRTRAASRSAPACW